MSGSSGALLAIIVGTFSKHFGYILRVAKGLGHQWFAKRRPRDASEKYPQVMFCQFPDYLSTKQLHGNRFVFGDHVESPWALHDEASHAIRTRLYRSNALSTFSLFLKMVPKKSATMGTFRRQRSLGIPILCERKKGCDQKRVGHKCSTKWN